MKTGIYRIHNKISGRSYVGSALNIGQRWHSHRSLLRRGKHHAIALQRSWKKHGEEAFIFETLEECDQADLVHREQHWIDALNAASQKDGFNTAPAAGSPRGFKHSAETRAKRSAQRKGMPWPKSLSHRAAISAARMGKSYITGIPKTAEHRANLSAAKKGKPVNFSAEGIAAITAALIKRNKSAEHRAKVSAAKKIALRGSGGRFIRGSLDQKLSSQEFPKV